MKQIQFNCPVEATLSLIGGKYKPLILWHLVEGMIHREEIPEKPPKTLYSLTAFGESVIPVLEAMCQWGTSYMDSLELPSARPSS